ncbi:MAG: cytochrome c oxidase subunit II [Verrucomicrobiota bacterium]|nr:cytochrome c oxidase subunit II [Verrucomicrobiota bacterium]
MSDLLPSIFDTQGPHAGAIRFLFVITLVICAVIFLIVTGMVLYSLVKFRWREGEAEPAQFAGNKTVELIWTAIPLVIVLLLFALTVKAMQTSDPPKPIEPDIVVVGKQWWWEIQYPKRGFITANEIHIPTGKPVALQIEAADVLHAFWVPQLTRQMTNIPGYPNNIWIQADKPGTYMGLCSEYCGTQHAWMRFIVVAEPQNTFDAWQQAQLIPATMPTGDTARGWEIFRTMSCINCHAIGGTEAKVHVGPDLTHFASRQQIAAGILQNTPENIVRWMRDPQAVKPGVKMPNFMFTEQQLGDLTAYLQTLK